MRANGELPSDRHADRHRPDAGVRREKPISLFIVPPRAQASRRCETTSDAKAASRQAPLAFRSLDPFRALRELDRRRRDEERPFPLRTKNRLTGRAPYKSVANLIFGAHPIGPMSSGASAQSAFNSRRAFGLTGARTMTRSIAPPDLD